MAMTVFQLFLQCFIACILLEASKQNYCKIMRSSCIVRSAVDDVVESHRYRITPAISGIVACEDASPHKQ